MDVREIQRALKTRYREDPSAAEITLRAGGSQGAAPVACSVEVGRAIHEAQAHEGVGGAGTAACSGDMLLGALAACAQVTCQMVAAAMGITARSIDVVVEGDVDLRGTMAIDPDAAVGAERISVRVEIDAPDASDEQLDALFERTERYCVVLQTLRDPPPIDARLVRV